MRLDEAARAFLGIPFKHQGRDPLLGIDCIGLLVLAGQLAGADFVALDRTDYARDPAHGVLEGYLEAAFGPTVAKASIRPGDVVAIDYKGATRHVGVVGEHPDYPLSLIHTNFHVGCVTEAGINAKWMKRIVGVYRVG